MGFPGRRDKSGRPKYRLMRKDSASVLFSNSALRRFSSSDATTMFIYNIPYYSLLARREGRCTQRERGFSLFKLKTINHLVIIDAHALGINAGQGHRDDITIFQKESPVLVAAAGFNAFQLHGFGAVDCQLQETRVLIRGKTG